MGQVSAKLRSGESGSLTFWCPGCHMAHGVRAGPNGWTFNGNVDQPTFTPSVLVTSGHYMPGHKSGDRCWCTFNAERVAKGEEPSAFKCERCHSFVTDGQIAFLGDSTHGLANQTVPLPDLPEHMRDGGAE